MIHDRISSVVALSDTAREPRDSRRYRSISGTRPEVDTVTLFCENANPRVSVKMSTAANTASTLCSGSPIPMKTTFVTSSLAPAPFEAPAPPRDSTRVDNLLDYLCSCESRQGPFAVKQNWQFIAQPSWDEMHTVVCPLGTFEGMMTLSTMLPPFLSR